MRQKIRLFSHTEGRLAVFHLAILSGTKWHQNLLLWLQARLVMQLTRLKRLVESKVYRERCRSEPSKAKTGYLESIGWKFMKVVI